MVELPYVFADQLGRRELERLADGLGRAVGGRRR